MDVQVLYYQNWMNETYSYHNEWRGSPVDGKHGSKTIFSMIQALQAEIGYANLSGNFGDGTLANVPVMKLGRELDNFTRILKGALWRAGYSAGNQNSAIDATTVNSIKKLQLDIGIQPSGEVDGYLWKALMTTDGYIKHWLGGSDNLRKAQQDLNSLVINNYNFAVDYLKGYLPCDGLAGRKMSQALIKYIQAIMGETPVTATGNLGNQTQKALPNLSGGSSPYIKVAKISLLLNGFDISELSPNWNNAFSNTLEEFKSHMLLSNYPSLNFTVWMALLISYGDRNRSYNACDTRFEITDSRLSKLKSMNISSVGRYLNGTDHKVIRDGEVKRIIDGGLNLIPIYQEDGRDASFFAKGTGKRQAIAAKELAIKNKIKPGNIIYFAVDYDAQNYDIENSIIPYFKEIDSVIYPFKSGVYGSRNVCNQVVKETKTTSTYVSNMSSGFSGNLGFKMPTDWNIDQFQEINVEDWGLDKLTYSGAFPVVSSYDKTIRDYSIGNFTTKLKKIELHYDQFFLENHEVLTTNDPVNTILNLFRQEKYTGKAANFSSGSNTIKSLKFSKFIKDRDRELYDYIFPLLMNSAGISNSLVIDYQNKVMDLPHCFFTTLAYKNSAIVPTFWSGWGGDLTTLASEIEVFRTANNPTNDKLQEEADKMIGGLSTFSEEDVNADLDAITLSEDLSGSNSLSVVFDNYYKNKAKNRFKSFKNSFTDVTTELDLAQKIYDLMNGFLENAEIAFPDFGGLKKQLGGNATELDYTVASKAFAKYIFANL